MPVLAPPVSRVRFRVRRLAFWLAIITYLDRVCISVAAPFIMDDLGLTVVQMGVVFSAFTLAYSLFEVPSGWLGDVMGPPPPCRCGSQTCAPRAPGRRAARGSCRSRR